MSKSKEDLIHREIELRENLITSSNTVGYADPPTEDKERITIMGEIVSAIGFEERNLCIFYEMMASENWEFDDFNTFESLGLMGEESELNQ